MGGVAIRTNGGLSEQLLADLLAMHGTKISLQLVSVAAFTADGRDAQAPLVVLRRVLDRHIETVRVVAAVARGIRLGLVVRIGASVERLAVRLDVFGNDAEPRLIPLLAAFDRLLPQLFVATGAVHLFQWERRVFDVRVAFVSVVSNVGVASHAL